MREAGFKCRQCGQCCINLSDAFQTCATEADIQRWEEAEREDILAWVDPIAVGDECVYDIWVNPKTGEDARRCPWLRKIPSTDRYACRIHDLKPDYCRRYPTSRRHAEKTGCPGFEFDGLLYNEGTSVDHCHQRAECNRRERNTGGKNG